MHSRVQEDTNLSASMHAQQQTSCISCGDGLQVRAGRDIEAIQYGSTILAAAKSAPSDDELLQEAVTLLGCCSLYIFSS